MVTFRADVTLRQFIVGVERVLRSNRSLDLQVQFLFVYLAFIFLPFFYSLTYSKVTLHVTAFFTSPVHFSFLFTHPSSLLILQLFLSFHFFFYLVLSSHPDPLCFPSMSPSTKQLMRVRIYTHTRFSQLENTISENSISTSKCHI